MTERVMEPVSSAPVAFPRPSLGVVAFGVVTFEKVALESMVTSSAMMLLHFEPISEPTAEEQYGAASDTGWSATPCLFLPPSQRRGEENWRWK